MLSSHRAFSIHFAISLHYGVLPFTMPNLTIARPESTEYAPDFGKYIALIPEGDIPSYLESQLTEFLGLLRGLSESESLVHHSPYTWSIKQVVGHMSDSERIFGYRALRIARNDSTPLPSFDENAFVQAANFDRLPFAELLAEFELVRRSHLLLFRHLEPEAWLRSGTVSNHRASVRAFAYVIAGHAKHHLDILHKRLPGR
jgi:hypothetical protein